MPYVKMDDIIKAIEKVAELRSQHYWENVIFAYQWWILVLITVVLWTIWIVLVDKRRLRIILLVGFMSSLLAGLMDDIGLSIALWSYPYPLTPFTSRLNTVDLAVIPVSYMLLYQYAGRWGRYLIVLILLSLFAVFIAEPTFGKLNMYITLRWEYWYSGPIYVAMGIFVKVVVDKLEKHASGKLQ